MTELSEADVARATAVRLQGQRGVAAEARGASVWLTLADGRLLRFRITARPPRGVPDDAAPHHHQM